MIIRTRTHQNLEHMPKVVQGQSAGDRPVIRTMVNAKRGEAIETHTEDRRKCLRPWKRLSRLDLGRGAMRYVQICLLDCALRHPSCRHLATVVRESALTG